MSDENGLKAIAAALAERFGEDIAIDPALPGLNELAQIAGHRSHRRYLPRPIAPELLRLLCACALSAPSKSDLQQCDIVIVTDTAIRAGIVATIPDMPWIMDAPAFLVFVANGERLPMLAKLHNKPFPNDHLDQFFNAAVDAAMALATFLQAASAVGLGCCPISAVRDRPQTVSDLLRLPQRVIPVAGLCVGWPAQSGRDHAAAVAAYHGDRKQLWRARSHQRDRRLRPATGGAAAVSPATQPGALGRSGFLRLVAGQGPPVRRVDARGLWCLRARQGILPGLAEANSVTASADCIFTSGRIVPKYIVHRY